MSYTLTLRLNESLGKSLEAVAQEQKVSAPELACQALEDWLAKPKRRSFKVLLNLAGTVEGPKDLSSNRKSHLKTKLQARHGSPR